jgi:hypothetical protein
MLNRLLSRYVIRPALRLASSIGIEGWPGLSAYECEMNDRALFRVPGMTSPRERAFVKFLARRHLIGLGEVVELGPFLGGLTFAMLRGLNHSKKSAPRVRVYDQFLVDPYMEGVLNSLHKAGQVSCSYQAGDSFRAEFELQIRSLQPQPEIIEGSLSKGVIREGPIELLVVDAMKDFETCTAIARSFYPDVVVGGFVLHQDFAHYWASWIHLLQYHLRNCFRFEFHVPMTSSVLYRCVRSPTEAEIEAFDEELCREEGFIDGAFESSLRQVVDGMAVDVQAAHVMAYVHCAKPDRARFWFDRYTQQGTDVRREMTFVRDKLKELS